MNDKRKEVNESWKNTINEFIQTEYNKDKVNLEPINKKIQDKSFIEWMKNAVDYYINFIESSLKDDLDQDEITNACLVNLIIQFNREEVALYDLASEIEAFVLACDEIFGLELDDE